MTKIIFLLATVMLLSACGSNSIIHSITVSTVVDTEQNQWVNLDSRIKLGSMQFPALTLPILNPKNTTELLGKVSLAPGVDGTNLLSIQANLKQLKNNAVTQDKLLPNGATIPIVGMDGVVSIKINERSKIYIGANANQVLVGLALVIPAFDSIGNYIPGASLFLPMPKESNVNGVAGAFTGGSSGQNGIGLFVLTPNTLLPNQSKATTLAVRTPNSSASNNKASVVVSDDSTSENSSLKRSLYFKSLKSQVLTVE